MAVDVNVACFCDVWRRIVWWTGTYVLKESTLFIILSATLKMVAEIFSETLVPTD